MVLNYPSTNHPTELRENGKHKGKRKSMSMHRFIWEKNYGKIPKGMIIHHKNGDVSDYRKENLELISHSEHTKLHYKKKKTLILPILILTFLFALSFLSAKDSTNIDFTAGYIIVDSPQVAIKQMQTYQENFFVYNSSSGALVSNTSINCTFFLANSSGNVLFSSKVPYYLDGHFGIDISGNNFSKLGIYPYSISCGNSYFGGSTTNYFEITGTGFEFNLPRALLYISILILFIILFFGICVSIPFLPSGDNRGDEGELISINDLKYIRPILIFVNWFILMSIVFLAGNLSIAYLGNELAGSLLMKIFYAMMGLSLPITIVWFIYIFYNVFKDKQLKRNLERGWE